MPFSANRVEHTISNNDVIAEALWIDFREDPVPRFTLPMVMRGGNLFMPFVA